MIASEYKAFQALEKITETYVAIKCFNIHVAVGETTFWTVKIYRSSYRRIHKLSWHHQSGPIAISYEMKIYSCDPPVRENEDQN